MKSVMLLKVKRGGGKYGVKKEVTASYRKKGGRR